MGKSRRPGRHTRFVERGTWATCCTYEVDLLCGRDGSRCVFVTSIIHNGSLGGQSGADAIRNVRATEAGLPGSYKAWLSDRPESLSTRFTQASVPYRRVD